MAESTYMEWFEGFEIWRHFNMFEKQFYFSIDGVLAHSELRQRRFSSVDSARYFITLTAKGN